uniref:Transmembrane protein n=1 Tax=Timema monikensis TaxID=170555 RepID=A0A7R9HLT3_9NEOP|nr:unnamed protein product [Timema monikensis]
MKLARQLTAPARIVVLCAVLGAVHFDHTVQCVHLLWEHVLGYLAIMICSLLVELFISVIAMRGSILDTEQRASIKYLIYIRLGVMLVETVWLALGIMWLAMHYINCPVEGAKEAVMGIVEIALIYYDACIRSMGLR